MNYINPDTFIFLFYSKDVPSGCTGRDIFTMALLGHFAWRFGFNLATPIIAIVMVLIIMLYIQVILRDKPSEGEK